MKQLFLLVVIIAFSMQTTSAQLFKKLKRGVQDKLEKKIEDKVVDELSEEIANRAMKPINSAWDEMFKKSYKDKYGKDYDDSEYENDPEKKSQMMSAVLSSMYGDVDLPDQYQFEYRVKIELHDFGEKKPNEMIMLVNAAGKIFGMIQIENNTAKIMVFDIEKDQVVIFDDKEKTGMAVSNVMKMTGVFAQSTLEDHKSKTIKFKKTNKKKKILGYESIKYEVETEDDEGEFYISEELPFDWADSFGGLVKQISPNFYKENPEYQLSGMMMLATTKRKKDGKKSKWEVKDISKETKTIVCSDYEFANMGNMD